MNATKNLDPFISIPLNESKLKAELLYPAGPLKKLTVLGETTSTNDLLRQELTTVPLFPQVITANHQLRGRGRIGRIWQDVAGQGIAVSIALNVDATKLATTIIPLLSGLALQRTIVAQLGVPAVLKWPNDIVVLTDDSEAEIEKWGAQRKLGGVLCEAGDNGAVIIGIGLNVHQNPDELPVEWATSLALQTSPEHWENLDRNTLIAGIVKEVLKLVENAQKKPEALQEGGELHQELILKTITIGQNISVENVAGQIEYVQAVGIKENGALQVISSQGGIAEIHSGDVYHVRGH